MAEPSLVQRCSRNYVLILRTGVRRARIGMDDSHSHMSRGTLRTLASHGALAEYSSDGYIVDGNSSNSMIRAALCRRDLIQRSDMEHSLVPSSDEIDTDEICEIEDNLDTPSSRLDGQCCEFEQCSPCRSFEASPLVLENDLDENCVIGDNLDILSPDGQFREFEQCGLYRSSETSPPVQLVRASHNLHTSILIFAWSRILLKAFIRIIKTLGETI